MHLLDKNIWLLPYPLPLLGADIRRNVTVLRLASGEIVVHSTGPFSDRDVRDILALGKPAWLLDTMLRHDTFARRGKAAFPHAVYLAPEGFEQKTGVVAKPLLPAPTAWGDELQVVRLGGVPSMEEHVVFHSPSRTLITADLIFNFGKESSWWTNMLASAAAGFQHSPGVSRAFKMTMKDRVAFDRSLAAVLAWDFDRIVPGHGILIERDGKQALTEALTRAGYKI